MATEGFTTCLWFDEQAEEAAHHYVSIFKNSNIGRIGRYGKEGKEIHGKDAGSVMTVEFELEGQKFLALNGGPQFRFTEAISLQADCKDQDEVDRLWETLSEGGEEGPCGWLKDRYGVSWQIVPSRMYELIADPDPERAQRAVAAMLQMGKLDIAELERAADGVGAPAR